MGVLEFYNKRLRHTRTVAVEELKTARQDMAVRLFEWIVGLIESDNADEHKILSSRIYFIISLSCFIVDTSKIDK